MSALALSRAVRRPLVAVSAVAALAAGVSACGSSSSGAASDGPEQAVPAGALVYAEAVVQPSGDEGANAEALLRKVLRTADPGAAIVGAFDRAAGDHKVNFARDVEPWLGQKVGAAMTRVSAARENGAGLAVLDSTDDSKAADSLNALLGGGTSSARYRDVEVRTARDRTTAGAVAEGHVLVGTPSEVRAGIDVVKGARESLGGVGRFTRAREASGTGGLGFVYADVRSLFRTAASGAGPAAAMLEPVADTLPDTVSATLHAESDAFVVDGAAIGGQTTTQAATGGGAADALAAVPADSWLGAGLGDIGKSLGQTLDSLAGAGLGSVGVAQAEEQVRRATGLDLRNDVLSWMGNAAVFVEGDAPGSVAGGLIVHSDDPAKSASAVRHLGRLLHSGSARVSELHAPGVDAGWTVRGSGLGQELLIAAAGDRFIVAVGRRALDDALAAGSTLGTKPEFRDAAGRLGSDYPTSLWLDLPAVARLVHAFAGGDADAERAAQTLQTFGPVAAGSKRDGDVARVKVRVAVP